MVKANFRREAPLAAASRLPTPADPVIIYDHPEKSLDYFYSITIKVPQRVTFIITQCGTTLLQLYTCYLYDRRNRFAVLFLNF